MDKMGMTDDRLIEYHNKLLNKQEVLIRNNVTTGEIETIHTGEIDSNAVSKALDMAYKVKGYYSNQLNNPITQNNIYILDVDSRNKKIQELRTKLLST
jgi:hypothetical protein